MQQWLISVNGTQSGPFDEGTVRAMMASGQIPPTALAWRAGLAEWTSVTVAFPFPVTPGPFATGGYGSGTTPTAFAPQFAHPHPHAAHYQRTTTGAATGKSRALGVVLAIILPGVHRIYFGTNAAMGMLQLFLGYLFWTIGIAMVASIGPFSCFLLIVPVVITAWAIYEAATLPIE